MGQSARPAPKAAINQVQGRNAWFALLIGLLACLPFLAAAKFGFVAWDDDIGLENNPAWRGIGVEQLRWMFTTFTLGHWQPLSWLSFGVEYALWGVDPARMHVLNIALHGLNAALFFLLALRILGKRRGSWAAMFAALFFALHPLRVESAAWITERAHLLATSLALASVLAWLKSAESTSRKRWRLVSIALFALSLMSKAWGMTLPFVLVILDLSASDEGRARTSAPRLALQQLRDKAAFFVLASAAMVVELLAKRGQVDVASLAEHGFVARAGQAGATVFLFVAKTIWPVGLSPIYEFRPGIDWSAVLAAIGVLALSALLFAARERHRGLFNAWIACLVLLAPVCGIAQSGLQRFADRYTYAAAMALALCVGVGLARLVEFSAVRRARWIGLALIVVLFVGESIASARQTEYWRDSETLWRRAVAIDPRSFIGWHNLATTLHRAERKQESAQAERTSIEIEPGIRSRDARFHLGQLEWVLGDRERAKQTWSEALRLDPADLTYLDWLASTQPSDAARQALWSLALEASPNNPEIQSRMYGVR